MSELMLPVASIFQNRLNANEMEIVKFGQLKIDVKAEDYDAITVSPVDVFYDAEARMDPRVTKFIPADADVTDLYIICDGFHRHKGASQLGLTHIRAVINHMTESDAMAHFYRRHKIHGEMNPILEAEMFRQELEKRGGTIAELAKAFNLTSASYVKTRLSLLNVTMDVVDLFYIPPADLPGKLTTEHLKSISYLPKNMQYAVAMMSLERNWRIEDIRIESKRIREGKGLRPVETFKKVTTTKLVPIDGIGGPPPANPTLIQRHLHSNIDRLLTPNEERIVRTVRKLGEIPMKELADALGLSPAGISRSVQGLCAMDVLSTQNKEKEGPGRRTKLYRLWVAEEQPKSEYVRDKPLTDEELFEQYPEVIKDTIKKKKPETLREKAKRKRGRPPQRVVIPDERVKPIGPDDWKRAVTDDPQPPPVMREPVVRSRKRAPLPPLVLNQDLIEVFSEAVYELAIREGLDLSKEGIEGRGLDDELGLEAEKLLYAWSTSKSSSDLIKLGLKVHQLYTRATHKRTER